MIGRFCADFEATIQAFSRGEIAKDDFEAQSKELIRANADRIALRDPSYTGVSGYHGRTLGIKLTADLGDFWRRRRASWGDDPYCVFFEWLGVTLANNLKTADGDDMLLGVMMGPAIQYATKVVLGVEERMP